MESEVKEGVMFQLTLEEAINKANSSLSGYGAKPILMESSAVLSPLFVYKVTMDYDFPEDRKKRTIITTLYVNTMGREVKVSGEPSFRVPFSVYFSNGSPPPQGSVLEIAKRELPSSCELLSYNVEETSRMWYPSSFSFVFSIGLTKANVKVNGGVKVEVEPLKREDILSLIKSEFKLEDVTRAQIKERENGYVVTYADEDWNGIMELNKVGVVLSKELKISQRQAVSIVERKVNGKALLVEGEFTVFAEDQNVLYKCKVEPHSGDTSCDRIGIPSSKVEDDVRSYFENSMFSSPSNVKVELKDDGWNVKASGETGVMEIVMKHDGSSIRTKFIKVNEKYGELWGRREFPGQEVKSTMEEDSIRVVSTDGNFEHVVSLSLDGKVKKREDHVTEAYAIKISYKTLGQVTGCEERVVRRHDMIIVDLLCNGKHHLVKLSMEGEVKTVLEVIDVNSLIGSLKVSGVLWAGYKENEVVMKIDQGKDYRYIRFSMSGEVVKEESCNKGFMSKIKCLKQDLEYRPSTSDPVDVVS